MRQEALLSQLYAADNFPGDKGYGSLAVRTWLRRRDIGHTVPERADRTRSLLRRSIPRQPQPVRHTGKHAA